jgi:hypothetical protein
MMEGRRINKRKIERKKGRWKKQTKRQGQKKRRNRKGRRNNNGAMLAVRNALSQQENQESSIFKHFIK